MKIAYQGDKGTFSYQAALLLAELFPSPNKVELASCRNFNEIFELVSTDSSVYGAVPLENSSMGSISINYNLFLVHPVLIVQELFLPVHHYLIGLPNTDIKSIKSIYSHPAALEQCRKIFKDNPGIKAIPHQDTSASVLLVKQKNDPTHAAIASVAAAKEHGLSILKESIEDFTNNTTRFGLITKASNVTTMLDPPYKLSLAIELPHQSGSLASFLTGISQGNINVTQCISRPIPELPWHYRFFLDMEIKDNGQHKHISELLNSSYSSKCLGHYPIQICS